MVISQRFTARAVAVILCVLWFATQSIAQFDANVGPPAPPLPEVQPIAEVETAPRSVLVRNTRSRAGQPTIRTGSEIDGVASKLAPAPSIWSPSITTVAVTKAEIRAAAAKSAIAQAALSEPVTGLSDTGAVRTAPLHSFVPTHMNRVVPATYSSEYVSQPTLGCAETGGQHCNCGIYGNYSPPLGSSVNAYVESQIYGGQKARQVLYHYDFNSGSREDPSHLNATGRRKLVELVPLLEATGQPLIVQSVPRNLALSEARKSFVLGFLQTNLGVPFTNTQVIVGDPDYLSLRGVEAAVIGRNLLQNTRAFGGLGSGAGLQSGSSGSRPRAQGQNR